MEGGQDVSPLLVPLGRIERRGTTEFTRFGRRTFQKVMAFKEIGNIISIICFC